ncbi:hypothetical protein [Natronoarchaeum rubrum]|uniref:hypothetical protein n=1 Tax=Natronoarchaeum rubrum TaxID=755311 RepID=UPI0021117CDB|nr:hypothetical protein [Natronoarchaeum rubrum]
MDDAGIRRRLDAIIALQLLLLVLALPGGPEIPMLIASLLVVSLVIWAIASLLARAVED